MLGLGVSRGVSSNSSPVQTSFSRGRSNVIWFPVKQQQYWDCKTSSSRLSELLQVLVTGSCCRLFNSSALRIPFIYHLQPLSVWSFSLLHISAQSNKCTNCFYCHNIKNRYSERCWKSHYFYFSDFRESTAREPVTSKDNSFFTLSQNYGLNPVRGKFVKLTDSSVLFWLLLGKNK